MHRPLDDIARDLRASVLGSEHEEAARFTEEYALSAQKRWEQMTNVERAASRLPAQANELLAWARSITMMHLAMTSEHLSAIDKAHRYLNARAQYTESSAR